jgi:ABC-type dipeptide/oligopeptide/nickel transport system ATPase component
MATIPDAERSEPRVSVPVLEIAGLSGGFTTRAGDYTPVLENVAFGVPRGTATAIVGETGSGKSLTMLAVLALTPRMFRITSGSARFDGNELPWADERAMSAVRGTGIAMVFQNSRAALNPVFTVGRALVDVLRLHREISKKEALVVAAELLERVYVSEPARRLRQYPHELSGGTAQRIQIALALACEPTLLILDEPTTGLDVTIQADILDMIVELNETMNMSTCLITHDLGVVAQTCQHMVVMRSGRVLESGLTSELMTAPAHAYTAQLLESSQIGRHEG